ncbi:MAG: transaldolase / glucose-6-phosphate isomerase [Thermoleophilaceae bacterium]|nr:transaldolase / glucose-6-phosphate isomerase [Thermoleophilaceae bacterium]MEA2367332.1 transaldolase / glucose-6-phosphate isomerase [Thermoleophilaceae bacterium]
MSVTVGVNERLAALTAAGTSIWLDQIRRSMIEGGEIQRLIDEYSLRGVTSNPAIFEKAILGSSDYDDQIVELSESGKNAREIYDEIAILDVQLGCDVLRPVYDETDGYDGFVSLEVGPEAAHDTDTTIEQARDYWRRVDRPNVMIKIPGTPAGVPAIEQAISEGINVNITLLFAVSAYEDIAEAYIRGLERRRDAGESLDVKSVASFFVSRVDSEIDKRLESAGNTELLGKAGVWNARAAYVRFKELFHGERFADLLAAGAPVQRPLWASTGVKNPRYPDTLYVEELVAPETVNTMPMPTMMAAGEKLEVRGATADVSADEVERVMGELAEAGIDMDDVTDQLLREGVELFEVALDKLLAGVESKREAVITGKPDTIESVMPDDLEPAIAERVRKAAEEDVARRIWKKDPTLWGGPGPEIGDRLGWLTIADQMLESAGDLKEFARACREDGLTDAVLLGMGGSSLAPEVFRRSFSDLDGMRLHVLDTTDPGAILATEREIDLSKTLFVVSSKSGGTIETRSQFAYFHARVREAVGDDDAGSHFVAVTDPGTALADLAKEHGFLHVFEADPEIGGRYSALSYFGLVPAALMGVDVEAVLERAQVAEQACQHYDHSSNNSGLWLGVAMGELALHRRDKLTFAVAEPIGSFGLWVEQLIAESTGKEGKGILPVAGERVGAPDAYGDDRVFVHLQQADAPEAGFAKEMTELAKAGHPTFTLDVEGPEDLGRIFFFAEFATAVAGWVLGINPFDQPNVQEAKDNTAKVLDQWAAEGELPEEPGADDEGLRSLLQQAEPPHYVAIMGYVQPSDAFDEAVEELRTTIRDATKATTTFGYGPRFLHSTGQLHKGGPKTGVFLQLVHDGPDDVEIPGAGYTFGTLKNAQATGDLQTLRTHGLPAERVRLEGDDPAEALKGLTKKIKEML